jgi:aminoglycoside phosphotransferase (APT) family kinase protein
MIDTGAHACGPPTMTRVHRANAAPPRGRAWQPGQRWNDIRWDGEAVVKRITRDEARRRRDVEVAMLTRLAGVVPLPRAFASEDPLADVLTGAGASVIHADPGPYNVIVDPEGEQIRALIDLELARIGDPIEDLALVEWHMRIWYRSSGDVLRHLYDVACRSGRGGTRR